jgi:hypothetical protein
MSRAANVHDIEALKSFRLALLRFAEKATNSLGEADAEVQRVTQWLENEASTHWTNEVRKRHAAVMKAKEALRYKQIFKSPTGGKQSTVDEEKAVQLALRRHAEAELKMANVKKWTRQLHKESHIYRGSVQRLGTTVSTDVPVAGAKILRMLTALEGYVALAAPSVAPSIAGGEASGMSRGSAIPEQGGYNNLRQETPAAPARDAAPDQVASVPWVSGEFAPHDIQTLEKLPVERQEGDPSSIVILAAGVQTVRRIYLERSPSAFPGDSGWYIGPADRGSAAPALEAVKAEVLLQARPHFSALLSLPVGSLVVIDAAGVAAVLNREDEDIWQE